MQRSIASAHSVRVSATDQLDCVPNNHKIALIRSFGKFHFNLSQHCSLFDWAWMASNRRWLATATISGLAWQVEWERCIINERIFYSLFIIKKEMSQSICRMKWKIIAFRSGFKCYAMSVKPKNGLMGNAWPSICIRCAGLHLFSLHFRVLHTICTYPLHGIISTSPYSSLLCALYLYFACFSVHHSNIIKHAHTKNIKHAHTKNVPALKSKLISPIYGLER